MASSKEEELRQQSELAQVLEEKKRTAWQIATGVGGAVWGGIESVVSSTYTGGKAIKDWGMNSSLMKWQVTESFNNKALPDGLESTKVFYESDKSNTQERQLEVFFTKVHFTGSFFKGASVSGIYPAIEIQFTDCHFDENTNFLGLAYHGALGHPKIKERLTNQKNGNIGGEKVITTVAEANRRVEELMEELTSNGKQAFQSRKAFVRGLIESVTLLQSGTLPEGYSEVMQSFDMSTELKMQFSEQEQIRIFQENIKPLAVVLGLEEEYLKLTGEKVGKLLPPSDSKPIPGAQPPLTSSDIQPNSVPGSKPVQIGSTTIIKRSPSLNDLQQGGKAPTIKELRQQQEAKKALNLQQGVDRSGGGKSVLE